MNERSSVNIQPIEKGVINQICSGQVILSLATAVKELVENSIDANATSIQIWLKEYGTASIEISDNGYGVEEKNFQALTLKHHTSKITSFSDLSNVETFGFRGEALSSLCTLSMVSIITKHKNSTSGTKLKFDRNGLITDSSKIARQTGTTVMIENIFNVLPVRHKEFLRNIKKEFSKMCNILHAYGLITRGVSITCSNQIGAKKLPVMETKGKNVKSNITEIFGFKQSQNLLEIQECAFDEKHNKNERKLQKSPKSMRLEGYISSCSHGCGRSGPDRQFFFINSRPIDNSKMSKIINEIYHQYNPHQYPFVVLNINISMEFIDVNVTPDKRLVFIKNESELISLISSTLHSLYQKVPAVVKLQNVGLYAASIDPELGVSDTKTKDHMSPFEGLKRFRSSSWDSKISDSGDVRCKLDLKGSAENKFISRRSTRINETCTHKIYNFMTTTKKTTVKENDKEMENELKGNSETKEEHSQKDKINEFSLKKIVTDHLLKDQIKNKDKGDTDKPIKFKKRPLENTEGTENSEGISEDNGMVKRIRTYENISSTNDEVISNHLDTDDGVTEKNKRVRKILTCTSSIEDVKRTIDQRKELSKSEESSPNLVRFYSKINIEENRKAEEELKKELSKNAFQEMKIIGQFNLGFIIAKLDKDVFIIDQHASDEKYNFEKLQSETKLQTQRLVVPQTLNLTVEREELFLHHSPVVRDNGFDFVFNYDEKPTNRIKLTSIPLSNNCIFGKDDIDELLFMLENAPNPTVCRPSKVRSMFASKACRKSVMIGTALNHFEMRRIVDHMGEIEQPWNCPHGRPTIRHLVNLSLIRKF